MSTKTLRKRIALVAVSALGAGLLSVVAVPIANATTGTLVGQVYENITSDGAAVVSATTASNGSYGLISVGTVSGGNQAVSMYQNGIIVIATDNATDKAQTIGITSGPAKTTGAAGAGGVECFNTGTAAALTIDVASCTLTDDTGSDTNRLFLAITPTGTGTIVVTGDNDTAVAGTWTVTIAVSNNIANNTPAGAVYVSSATSSSNRSQGLIGITGSGVTQTATMYSNGILTAMSTAASTAQKISVTGGTFVGADKVAKTGGTLAVAADLTSATLTANASNQLFASIKPSAAGTPLIISGYDDSAAAANWIITVTVVAAGSSGTFSAGYSNIALTAAGSAPESANIDTAGVSTVENNTCVYLYYSLADALSLPLTGASVIGKVSSGMTVAIGATTGTLPVVTGTYSSATYLKACQDSLNVNKPVSGTLTLTVDGVDVATRSITIVGQLASITVTEGAIAVRNEAGTTDSYYGPFSGGSSNRSTGAWYASHSYVGKDSAGNLVPVTAAIVTTTLNAQVTALGDNGAADPRNANPYLRTGGLTFACADTSGSNSALKVKATAADTTTIYSNAFNVTCAGDPVNYKASTNKAVYNTGDVMEVTVTFTDKSGKTANDYALISKASYVGTIASGAISSTVVAPSSAATGETAVSGAAKYKYIVGQTAGTYSVAVDFPNVNNTTYGQSALTLPVTVANPNAGVTDEEVLKAIVSLIASINKQIAALQKALLKK